MKEKNSNIFYALAVDDGHNYHASTYEDKGPGKGWVVVKAEELTPEALLDAIDKGDFYASTGVEIRNVKIKKGAIEVEIEPKEGEKFLTEFIGTRRGFDETSTPAVDSAGAEMRNTTRIYSNQIGEVLANSDNTKSGYSFEGDELYVRIRITSSADHIDRISGKVLGKQKAWLQPVIPGSK